MTASTSAAVLDLLRDSQVLSPEELKRAESLVGSEADPKAAARRLLSAGLITQWQAGQLLRSRPTLSLGKYVLLDRLAWGSSHAVFLAKHPMMERKVALSVLDRNSSSSSQAVNGFLKDARSIAGLDHRNLIHVFDVDQADDRYYLVMEYVQGKNLDEVVRDDGPMPVEAAADLIRQVADGLEHAHRSGLTHGGLRPSNVILDAQGTAKIIDLGVAQLDDPVSAVHTQEDDSKILSVADFLSPEQAAGEPPKPASDIYSLGCVGFWLLAGKAPFGQGDFKERMQRHVTDETPDVRSARPDVPPGLAEIIARMMAKKPTDRYPTARNVVAALDKWWSEYSAELEAAKPKPAPARAPAPKVKPAAAAPPGGKAAMPGKNKPKADAPSSREDAGVAPGMAPVIITTGKGARPSARQPARKPVAAASAAKAAGSGGFAALEGDFSTPAAEGGAPVDLSPKAVAAKKSPPVLLLAAVGGGLVLLGIAGGLAAYLLWGTPPEEASVAAGGAGDQTTALKPPEAPPTTNGNSGAGDGSTSKPPDEGPSLPKPGEGNPPPDSGGETAPPTDPPATDPPATDPPVTDPPATDPPATDPPADPPKDPPADDPPKDPPKDPPPAAGGDPFRDFASAVELPPAAGEGAAVQKVLGPIHLPPDKICYIDLLGGEAVDPKGKRKFTLENARGGLAERDWEFKFGAEGEQGALIATLSLGDKGLQFAWTAEAAKSDAAPYLANCLLELRTSDHTRQVQLRTPHAATAIGIRFDRPLLKEKFELPNAPPAKQVRVELIKLEGAEKVSFEPKRELAADKDSTIVWVGEGEGKVLAFKVDAVMQRDDLQLTVTPYVTVGGSQAVKYNARQMATAYNSTLLRSQQLTASIAEMQKNAETYKQQISLAQQQLQAATKTIEQFDKLKKHLEAFGGGGALKFRVYFAPDEEHKVMLIEGTAPPPAEAPKGTPREAPRPAGQPPAAGAVKVQ